MPEQSSDTPNAVPNLDARLTPDERALRKSLLDLIVQTGRPVTPVELAAAAGLSTLESAALVKTLQAKGLLVLNHHAEIAFAYPLSSLPTPHRVTLADGRSFYAMCAIDALGCAFEFAQDTRVTSACSHCQEPLSLSLTEGRLESADPPTIQVLHVDLDQYADWAASC